MHKKTSTSNFWNNIQYKRLRLGSVMKEMGFKTLTIFLNAMQPQSIHRSPLFVTQDHKPVFDHLT